MRRFLLLSSFFIILMCLVPLNLKNDLDGNLFQVLYLKSHFSLWNPQLHQGLPTMGDPINFFWHPLASLVLVFPVELSVRAIDVICWISTIIFAYFLFRYLSVKKNLALWLALTYAASSYFLARVIAGHLEKVLSYPLIPLFFLSVVRLQQKPSLKRSGFLAIVFYLLLASTDMYNFFYLAAGFGIYLFLNKKTQLKFLLLSLILAILFSAVRWLPMLSVLSHLFKIPDPYSGSQNLISLILQMTVPKVALLTSLIPSNFGWWEKTAFIGPLFLLGIFGIKKRANILAVTFGLTAVAISMPRSVLSPWHWLLLIPQFTEFHVPTRVFGVLSLCLIILTAPIIAKWNKWGIRLVQLNLIMLAVFWLFIFKYRMLPAVDPRYVALEHFPHEISDSILYPAFDKPVLEREWQNDWQLFHTTHGTYIQGSPAADWTSHLVNGINYTNALPNYEVWPDSELAELPFPGTPVASASGITLYKTIGLHLKNDNLQSDYPNSFFYYGAAISLLSMSLWAAKFFI